MVTITHSSYTGEFGLRHLVLQGSQQVTAPSEDEKFVAQYARELYHKQRGAASLVRWNGDSKLETVLDEKR